MKSVKLFDIFTVKYDVNGNTVITVSGKSLGVKRGVTFQIGSLGITSRNQLFSMSFEDIKQAIFDFVKEHGTARQKMLFCTDVKIQLNYIIKGIIDIQYANNDKRRDVVCFQTLTDKLLDNIITVICTGCRHNTKKLFRQCLSYAVNHESNADHYAARTTVINNTVSYCGGQVYTDDLAEFRKAVIY